MSSLSYQEKSLYGSLVAEIVVYGSYFFLPHQNSIDRIAGVIFGMIMLQIVIQALIAGFTRNRIVDERDKLILLRGYRAAYIALVSMMVVGMAMLWFHSSALHNFNVDNHKMGMHFLTVFFGMLMISDVVKTVSQLVAYRRAL